MKEFQITNFKWIGNLLFVRKRDPFEIRNWKFQSGFTLIELLVVISIISIITGIGFANFQNAQANSRDARRKADLKAVSTALLSYYQDNGSYPPACTTNCTNVEFTSASSDDWIPDLYPNYIKKFPKDPKQGAVTTGQVAGSQTGVVAAYGFSEGTGGTTADISGNNNGSLVGAQWTTGKFGYGLQFNGASSVSVSNSATLNLTNGFTIMAWINPANSGSDQWKNVISKGDWRYYLYSENDRAIPHWEG